MIILKSKKINCFFKNILQNYENITNFGPLECPNCHSKEFKRWGYYERGVIFFSYSNENILESRVIKIQRVRCNSCGKTHALLPFGIVPYKQFSDEVLTRFLKDSISNKPYIVANKYNVDESVVINIIKQFKEYHLSNVSIFTKCHNINNMLKIFLGDYRNKIRYINVYNKVFMQIKNGCLGLCPS